MYPNFALPPIRAEEVARLIEVGSLCGLDKDERLFFFAVNRVYGNDVSPTDIFSKVFDKIGDLANIFNKEVIQNEETQTDTAETEVQT